MKLKILPIFGYDGVLFRDNFVMSETSGYFYGEIIVRNKGVEYTIPAQFSMFNDTYRVEWRPYGITNNETETAV